MANTISRVACVLVSVLILSGCAGYIAQIRQIDSAIETSSDEAYDLVIGAGCSMPIDIIARAVERRGDDYAYARYLTCPSVRTLVDAVGRRGGAIGE